MKWLPTTHYVCIFLHQDATWVGSCSKSFLTATFWHHPPVWLHFHTTSEVFVPVGLLGCPSKIVNLVDTCTYSIYLVYKTVYKSGFKHLVNLYVILIILIYIWDLISMMTLEAVKKTRKRWETKNDSKMNPRDFEVTCTRRWTIEARPSERPIVMRCWLIGSRDWCDVVRFIVMFPQQNVGLLTKCRVFFCSFFKRILRELCVKIVFG